MLDTFLQLIPHRLSSKDFHLSPKAFVRQSKLTLPILFIFLLSLTASGKRQGVDGKAGAFFRHARRSGLWPEAEAVHGSVALILLTTTASGSSSRTTPMNGRFKN